MIFIIALMMIVIIIGCIIIGGADIGYQSRNFSKNIEINLKEDEKE